MNFLNSLSTKIGMGQAHGKSMKGYEILYNILEFITKPYVELRYHVGCIKRACAYFKHGYFNYDFDSAYVIADIKFKLERLEKCIRNGYHLRADEQADEIKVAIELCKRILDCDYLNNALAPHEEKWGEQEMVFEKCEDNKYLSRVKFRRHTKANNDEEEKLANESYRRACEHSDKMEKQDIIYLFDYMKKHFKCWWD